MPSNITPYDHPQQVQGREIHTHDETCGAFGCDLEEGKPNNQNWDPREIAKQSPIDRAGHAARRVRSRASELMGSLKEHFGGSEEESAPAPFVPPTPAPRKAPDAIPMYTADTPYNDRLTGDHSSGSMAQAASRGHNIPGSSVLGSIVENAARRLKNHVAGAATGGTHLMSWTRGDTHGDKHQTHRVEGANGESMGGEIIGRIKRGDLKHRDPYETYTQEDADSSTERMKGPQLADFFNDLKHRVMKSAGAGAYHVAHKVTLTPEGASEHKTSSLTLHGADLGMHSRTYGSRDTEPLLRGEHQEGTPDSRGVRPTVYIKPEHIQKVEVHTRKG